MIRKFAQSTLLCGALFFTSCFQIDEKTTLNPDGSGKTTMVVTINAGALMQGLGGLGGAEGGAPDVSKMGKDIIEKLISSSQGVDVWSEAKTEKTAEGAIKVTATCYFKDINKLKLGNPMGGGGGGGGAEGGMGVSGYTSKKEGDNWVIGLGGAGQGGAKENAEPAEKTAEPSEEEIEAKMAEIRQGMAMMDVMGAMMEGLKSTNTLTIGGTITDSGLMTKVDDSSAKIEINFKQILAGMKEFLADDENVKAMARLESGGGGSNPFELMGSSDPKAKEVAEKLMQLVIGKKGKPEVTAKAGAPVFNYEEEAAAAKKNQSPELKELLNGGDSKDDASDKEESKPADKPKAA